MKLHFIVPALLFALPVARTQDAAPTRAETADRAQRDALSLEVGGGRLVLRPLLENAIRVRFTRGGPGQFIRDRNASGGSPLSRIDAAHARVCHHIRERARHPVPLHGMAVEVSGDALEGRQ